MNNISQLKSSEYKEGALLALDNSKRLIKAVEAIAEIGQHQIALSLMITALEELCKAVMLQIKGIDTNIQITNLDLYFRSHELKHESIFNIVVTTFEFSKILDDKNKENEDSSNDKEATQENENPAIVIILIVLIFFLFIVHSSGNEKEDTLEQQKHNAETTEQYRQMGLYFNFDKQKKEWVVPYKVLKKNDYEVSKMAADFAFELIESALFKENVTSKNINEFVELLQDNENMKPFIYYGNKK